MIFVATIFYNEFILFQANVGNRDKDPKFIRHLMTAILETTLGMYYNYIFFRILSWLL